MAAVYILKRHPEPLKFALPQGEMRVTDFMYVGTMQYTNHHQPSLDPRGAQ
jgi:hypothetical protein